MLLEHIHGVVVSDGYADYLDVSLSYNRSLFSTCVVVTSPEDTASQKVALKHNCVSLVTADGRRQPGSDRASTLRGNIPARQFNKGLMIERGLQQLPGSGWRCHFDADMVFPASST